MIFSELLLLFLIKILIIFFVFNCSSEFVRQYSMLYIKNRTDTVEALETLPQLKHAHHLKAKILFSIIVVSIRIFFFNNLYLIP